MDDESGESTEEYDVTDVGRGDRQRQRDWDEVDGREVGAGSIEMNYHLFETRMMQVWTRQ